MDIDKWISQSKAGIVLEEKELQLLCEKAKEFFFEESNVRNVQAPVTVCGDIHGQFQDLLELFRIGGDIPEKSQIFMGDIVNRGQHSLESLQQLLCLKVKYPGNITILRGNHECRQVSLTYGLYEEILRVYGNANPWKQCNDLFDQLPLCALIEGQIFCVHGGLSQELSTIDQIRTNIERKQEVPQFGALTDLLWSDPDEIEDWGSLHGPGWIFGRRPTKLFNKINGLKLICRGHQLANDGYKMQFDNNLVTIWSAPNYVQRCGNVASIMEVNEKLVKKFFIFKDVSASKKSKHFNNLLPYFL